MTRLTTAQAIVRYLGNQFIDIDGVETRLCGGGFGIFGHGNVPCLGEALYSARDILPLYRGQNEQSMGFAAAAYAKYHLRRRFMFCTASAGPGTANLLTAAALAHANRLPLLMLCGDVFVTRLPDPVLQQLEHFGAPSLGLNDAFSSAVLGSLAKVLPATWSAARTACRAGSFPDANDRFTFETTFAARARGRNGLQSGGSC
jgi:3D-(3,5/4)-trihydroxycyclohexane-1,2-dione acylhydrolase (decyclizing)